MIKAIFFDIDGTLVSFNTHHIPSSTFDALKKLKENDIKIFIATGRGKDGLFVLNDFEFDGYITLNGQYCYTKDKIIYENTIDKNDLKHLLEHLEEHPFPCGFTEENTKYFNMRDERVDEIHKITHNDNHPAGDCSQVIHHKVYQCMCFVNEDEEKELLKVMPHCIAARWHPLFCDISPIGGTKQNGIDQFLKYYHIDLSQTMAFGDGGNDKQMLEHVAISVAMGNANKELKQIADYITDDVDNDGIVKALKHYHLI
ncbi:MAG: Cof-type HAD-IIB family hydrolase [Erysipelotrichaceae bacterium]|nr:Cof-type HAD-IIB family hydrolase [Erysipelotrichaceae bacterium]